MKKTFKIFFVLFILVDVVFGGYFTAMTFKQNKELKEQNVKLNDKVSALDPEIGVEKNGVVYASADWSVYNTIESANSGKDSIGKLSNGQIIQTLVLNNSVVSIDLRNTSKIGIRYTTKNTIESFDGVHKKIVYAVTPEIYISSEN